MSHLRRDLQVDFTLDHFPSKGVWIDLDFLHTSTKLLQFCIISQPEIFLGMKNKKVTFGKIQD